MITLKNVSKWYGHFQVLTDCSTEVKKGEVVVVCGPSGSGKSTLIKTVNGLEPVQQGEITVDGIVVNDKKTDLAKLRSRVGMVFQHFELFPHLSIIENLTLAQVKVLKRDKAPAREKALKLLERVGLSAHANKFPAQLSGGQQQRVAIARALINDPEIIMADEPTGNLDSKSGKEIMELLIRLNKEEHKTIILVTHDPKIGKQVPRVISVFDGMLGSEEEQAELKRWTDVNYSKLEGLAGEKAALGDNPEPDPAPKADEANEEVKKAQEAADAAVKQAEETAAAAVKQAEEAATADHAEDKEDKKEGTEQ